MTWFQRLSGQMDRLVTESVETPEIMAITAWVNTASEMPGARALLDAHRHEPALPRPSPRSRPPRCSAGVPANHPDLTVTAAHAGLRSRVGGRRRTCRNESLEEGPATGSSRSCAASSLPRKYPVADHPAWHLPPSGAGRGSLRFGLGSQTRDLLADLDIDRLAELRYGRSRGSPGSRSAAGSPRRSTCGHSSSKARLDERLHQLLDDLVDERVRDLRR